MPTIIFRAVVCAIFLSASVFAKDPSSPATDQLPLDEVIKQVTAALQQYQDNRGSGATYELPPLSTAEFDFKTTVAKTAGFTFSFLIFKFGTSHEKDVVNDVTYTYALPEPKKGSALQGSKPPPTLKDELAQAIQAAASAVKTSSTAAGLPFSKLTINLQYGVKWDVSGGASPVISLVTVGLNGDVNKNTIQSVKIVFGK